MSSFHFLPLESIQHHSPRMYVPHKKGTYPDFRMPLCCLADGHGRKAILNWKLKISNTTDNACITQSQARDTRHRRMQEVNSLCTDSGPLRAKYCTVAFHTIQPSSSLWANHGYTLRGKRTVLTRSAITAPKLNRFG